MNYEIKRDIMCKGDFMIKIMKQVAIISFIATLLFLLLNITLSKGIFTTLAITSGTVFYHFSIRLIIGYSIDGIFKNRMDYNKGWFKPKSFEEKLYRFLKVKNWKAKMPTAVPENFDLRRNNPYDVAWAMCQAEVVHEINIVASFLPIVATICFGAFWVFFITSLFSACYDMMFVIIQRYNRPRILSLAERKKNSIKEGS